MKTNSTEKPTHHCDRCGHAMIERSYKISCPNCGNRFDCSDLTVYMTPLPTDPPTTTYEHIDN